LVATVLAAISLALVNQALLVVSTRVGEIFTDGPLEEAFAAFAAVHAIVLSCGTQAHNNQPCFEPPICMCHTDHAALHPQCGL